MFFNIANSTRYLERLQSTPLLSNIPEFKQALTALPESSFESLFQSFISDKASDLSSIDDTLKEFVSISFSFKTPSTPNHSFDKNFNFWITSYPLITNPSFRNQIKKTSYYNSKINKLDLNKTATLISNNELFTVWLANRIGEFENINTLNNISTNNSSGIYGKIELNLLENTFL
jgi:hypothetical protein